MNIYDTLRVRKGCIYQKCITSGKVTDICNLTLDKKRMERGGFVGVCERDSKLGEMMRAREKVYEAQRRHVRDSNSGCVACARVVPGRRTGVTCST